MTPRIEKIAELILSKDPLEKTLGETMLKQWTKTHGKPTFSEFEVGKSYIIAYQMRKSMKESFLEECEIVVTHKDDQYGILHYEDKRFESGGSIGMGWILAWSEV